MSNFDRDYLDEALHIIKGETMMLAQRQHLLAIWYNIGRLAEQVVEKRERERRDYLHGAVPERDRRRDDRRSPHYYLDKTPDEAKWDSLANNPELRG